MLEPRLGGMHIVARGFAKVSNDAFSLVYGSPGVQKGLVPANS